MRFFSPLFSLACGASLLAVAHAAQPAADPLLEPPVVNTSPGPEYQENVRAGAMIIGMDRTPKGRIWGCWTGTGDNTESYFILATSDDGGTTWSKPRVVIDPQEIPGKPPRYSLIGNLWTDPSGRLWLFFDQQMKGGVSSDWYVTCDNPDADQPVWSRPVFFADGSTLNKPTILKNGDWLLPVSLLAPGRTVAGGREDGSHQPGAHVYASTDQGRTWRRRGGVRIPDEQLNHNEHMMVELRDGRIWMLLRTTYGIAETYSADGGRTWTETKPSALQNPSTRFFLRRLASGRLLLVKNGPLETRLPGRSHLTAFLSEDEGRTWGRGFLLDDRKSLSYPDGFEAPDGLIHILYDWNRHTDAEILLTTFREEDIRAGKFESPGAHGPLIVDKARAPELSQSNVLDRKLIPAATADGKLDRQAVIFDASATKQAVSDVGLNALADGSWVATLQTRAEETTGSFRSLLVRSRDGGKSWSSPESLQLPAGTPGGEPARGLHELVVGKSSVSSFYTTGNERASSWRAWRAERDAKLSSWATPRPLPGPLARATFGRNPVQIPGGALVLPFQHFESATTLDDPRCGVLASTDDGHTWRAQGEVRLGPVRRDFDWTETNVVPLGGSRVVMLIPQPWTMGLVYVAESSDGGKTWPEHATLRRAPTGGTMALFSLGGDRVAMIHNPATKLALWVSRDGMATWPYQRTLADTACGGPKDYMRRPHGFVSADGKWLHFAFVDASGRAVAYSARLPE